MKPDISHCGGECMRPNRRRFSLALLTLSVGLAADPIEAYRKAYLGDPNAAMGGVLACNFTIESGFAAGGMASLSRWGKAAGPGGCFVQVGVAAAL